MSRNPEFGIGEPTSFNGNEQDDGYRNMPEPRYVCARCEGTGIKPWSGGQKSRDADIEACPDCDGDGVIVEDEP